MFKYYKDNIKDFITKICKPFSLKKFVSHENLFLKKTLEAKNLTTAAAYFSYLSMS